MKKIHVLLIEDKPSFRAFVQEAINQTHIGKLIGFAANGHIAAERLKQMKIHMVVCRSNKILEDIQVFQNIRRNYPDIHWVILSEDARKKNFPELSFLTNFNVMFVPIVKDEIRSKRMSHSFVHVFSSYLTQRSFIKYTNRAEQNKIISHPINKAAFKTSPFKKADLIIIAASTGGPDAVEKVCEAFDDQLAIPVIIVQHMPKNFTGSFARSLNEKTGATVIEGKHGEIVKKGQIIVAPGGVNSAIFAEHSFKRVIRRKSSRGYVALPSADVMFESAAEAYEGKNVLAVVLTGMGNDGTAGLQHLKRHCNCFCMIQNEETSVVYSMPKHVKEAGLADEELSLYEIPARIRSFL
ncbi:MAG: hypothetical protein H0Z32_03885 [Bacillaceae bacterium]|nr:hypothetical protein [Bacillaceae bacterium]